MESKIYLQTLLTTLSFMVQCQQPITCDAGHFKAGETASVTCNFHKNLEDIGHHVFVTQHPLDAPDDSVGYDIAWCYRSFDHKLICDAAKGVQINTDITDRLTVHIPEVTTDFAGRYVCQLVPPDDLVMVFCSLTVEEGTFTQTKTDTENVAESEDSSWFKFVVIAASFLFGILLGIACLCCFRSTRTSIPRKQDQYNSKIPKDQNVQVVAGASVGLSDRNDYSGTKQHPTDSGKQYSPVCQDMSFEPCKPPDSSTCRARSCINSALKSHNDQIDIPSSKLISTVRSNVLTSISCKEDDGGSCSRMQSVMYADDFYSGSETDGSCSFHSSTDVIIAESCPPTVTIVADPADDGMNISFQSVHFNSSDMC